MMLGDIHATLLFVIIQMIAHGKAQRRAADWMWGFGNGVTADAGFDECQRVPLFIIPPPRNSTLLGIPPYYLLTFEVGGIPTTQMIGNSSSQLLWTVDHKRDTQILVTIMDSAQNIGGFPRTLYNIYPGPDASCIPSALPNPPIVHPNVTDTLRTCEPWGLTITGGKKPYTIVLAAVNEPIMENGTMGANDDVYTYINRFNPNRQLLASVVDADGQWGKSTQLINTIGGTDFGCASQTSSSNTFAQIAQQAADRKHAEHDKNVKLIAGLSAGLGAAAVLGIGALFWLVRRRIRSRNESRPMGDLDASISPLEPFDTDMTQVYTTGQQPKVSTQTSFATTPLQFDHQRTQASPSSPSDSGYAQSNPYGMGSGPTATYHQFPSTFSPPFFGTTTRTPEGQSQILTQDQGSGFIQELPPPYVERSARPARSPPPPFGPLSTTASVPDASAGSRFAGTSGVMSPGLGAVGAPGLGAPSRI